VTLRPSATWRDALLAGAAAGAACLALLHTDLHAVDPALREPDAFATAVTAGAGLAGFWWHTHPARWFAATALGAVTVAAAGHYAGLLPWLATAALCAVAARHPRRRSLAALAAAVAGYSAISVAGIPDNAGDAFLSTVALLVAAWALGDGVRLRRGRVAAELHAARSDAAAARQEAARATTEERLRIARELHDVVAHSMSLIAVHAGVGAHLIRSRPDQAERTLEVIADTSREALAQTRSLLGLLRDDRGGTDDGGGAGTGGATGTGAQAVPLPGAGGLPGLVDAVRGSGLDVTLDVRGEPPLDLPAVQLAAYRIVQESLTNVVKHAHATTVAVRVEHTGDATSVEVTDDGTAGGAGPVRPGHGLRGLTERAALLGGRLTAGPGPHGGFRVQATLPLPATRDGTVRP
jgi:signal transduction histidine kinase